MNFHTLSEAKKFINDTIYEKGYVSKSSHTFEMDHIEITLNDPHPVSSMSIRSEVHANINLLTFEKLPVEIIFELAAYLDAASLRALAVLCKTTRKAAMRRAIHEAGHDANEALMTQTQHHQQENDRSNGSNNFLLEERAIHKVWLLGWNSSIC